MNMFTQMLKEATEEIETTVPSETVVPTDAEPTDTTGEETPEETPAEEGEEAAEGTIQKQVQDIIDSILDAIEQESLASGETFDEGESIDVGLEILYKLAPKLSDEDAQAAYDELSEYFEMSVEDEAKEGEEEESAEEFFEEPAAEGDDTEYAEDKTVKESIKKK